MRTALSPFQIISLERNAPTFSVSNDAEKSARSDAWLASENSSVDGFNQSASTTSYVRRSPETKPPKQDSGAHGAIRSRRSPMQVEPRQGINQSWDDFQREHFEWSHGRAPTSSKEISPDEGRLPSPSVWQAVWELIIGFVFGGPAVPEDVAELPAFRPEEVERFSIERGRNAPKTETNKLPSIKDSSSSDVESNPYLSSLAPKPKDFELKNLDPQGLVRRFNVYYRPGKNQEYVKIDGKWYASAKEKGQRFVYKPNDDGVASTWPVQENGYAWRFTPRGELPGRSITPVERIPSGYRVDAPADLQEADAQGIYRAAGQEYIKLDGLLYRSGQDGNGRYIYDGNPSHRIAVRRSDQGWDVTPPSRGLGGAPLTPEEVVQNVFNMTKVQARDYLSQYRFDTRGFYTESTFSHELSSTLEVPGWAEQFRVRWDTPSLPSTSTSAPKPAPAGGMDVINPVSQQPIHIDEGGYLNSAGFIERTDMPTLYRVIDKVNAGKNDPSKVGFRKSYLFNAIPKMMRGPAVITSEDVTGPNVIFGHWDGWGNSHALYQIDGKGLKTVSLRENIKSNPGVMDRMLNIPQGTLAEVNAIPDEAVRLRHLDNFTYHAYSANEVHVENEHLDPSRITFREGAILKDLPLEDYESSPDSAKTWAPSSSSSSSGTPSEIPPAKLFELRTRPRTRYR
jgi:hypothetical protein